MAKTEKNDQQILELRKKIEEKEKALNLVRKHTRFSPVTNLVIDFEGAKQNLNVLKKDSLKYLYVKLYMINEASKELNFGDIVVSGFTVEQWLGDISAKLKDLDIKEEQARLEAMEQRLMRLLSEETRVELEIDELGKLI